MRETATKRADGLDASVMAVFKSVEELVAKPATDAQLARIWPPWNALPDEMRLEEKCNVLTREDFKGARPQPGRSELLKGLRKRFDYLPLDKREYHQALNAACCWARLKFFLKTTVELHKDLVSRQWAFAEADNQASGRVAIFRAAKELNLLQPGFLECPSPTLADIALFDNRYTAYSNAREQALAALSEIVFKVPGIRTGKELPWHEQALGVPHPPNDVPRHLFLARLDALGICSNERLAEFMRAELPKLSRAKRQEFYAMSLKSHHGKEPYAALRVWLLENRPIFEHDRLGWQWTEIQTAAKDIGIDCPSTSLKQWAFRNRIGLRLKRGPATVEGVEIALSAALLTPAPVFGDVLKSIPK
jgi:hypothetical protein